MILRERYRQLGASPDEADALADAESIRHGLKGHDGVRMECFNRSEAMRIRAKLTVAENERVALTFLFDDVARGQETR